MEKSRRYTYADPAADEAMKKGAIRISSFPSIQKTPIIRNERIYAIHRAMVFPLASRYRCIRWSTRGMTTTGRGRVISTRSAAVHDPGKRDSERQDRFQKKLTIQQAASSLNSFFTSAN